MLSGMAALNGGLGATGLTNGTAGTMDALTQAYSGIQQYAAAALPTLYSQSLLQQQSAAGSQKEGKHSRPWKDRWNHYCSSLHWFQKNQNSATSKHLDRWWLLLKNLVLLIFYFFNFNYWTNIWLTSYIPDRGCICVCCICVFSTWLKHEISKSPTFLWLAFSAATFSLVVNAVC